MRNKINAEESALKNALSFLQSITPFKFRIEIHDEEGLDLERVLRRSSIRYRSVRLREGWLQEPSSPVLAFEKSSGHPLILYTNIISQWVCYNGATGKSRKVTNSLKNSISEGGYVFYRPLPEGKLRKRDLLFYSLRGRKVDLILIFVLSAVMGLMGLALPMMTGLIYDQILPHKDLNSLVIAGILLLLSAIAGGMFQFTQGLAINRLSFFLSAPLEAALWDRVINLPSRFFRNHSAGNLGARLFGIRGVQSLVTSALVAVCCGAFTIVLNIALMFLVNPKLGSMALIAWVLHMLVTSYGLYKQIKYQRPLNKLSNQLSSKSLDIIRAISRIKVHGAEKFAFRSWAKIYSENKSLNLAASRGSIFLSAFHRGFSTLTTGIFIWVIISMPREQMSVGQFLTFSAAFGIFLSATTAISQSIIQLGLCIPTIEQLEPVLEERPEPKKGKRLPSSLTGKISISNLCFSYDQSQKSVLNSINLDIPEGSSVAIVGASGAGKSTLLRLLLGFETPSSGEIFYDHYKLDNMDIDEMRRQFGVVLQDGKIMPGSIIENVIGATACNRDQAIEACKLAEIHDDIEAMPMGYETIIREGLLSGGQQQRLLIARAIVNQPKIIFFDEATSALDNKTQKVVSESIDALNATRIIIAHRLSTIQNSDKIVVLDKGNIVEQGDFKELMARNGEFSKLAKRQI